MGIQGLLPLLKSIHRQTELKKFAGETLGVDAYGWLHRGAVSCAVELAQGKPTRKYVDFAMHRVRMVKHFGATPYLVFDGDFLPSKASTESSRAKRREESRKAGFELLNAGKPSQAYLELQKAIDVTPEMARHLIEELKKAGIPYVVAPYEADAQMVYLEQQGIISGIISEDSDLLVFGAKRLLTKLDPHGQCVEINRRDFCSVREISLTGWTDAEFRHMAIFSGCDYLDGINGMGLKTAYRMIRKHKTPERVIRMIQFEGKLRVSENYQAAFRQAELTFLHQRVFCPKKQELVFLSEPDSSLDVENMPFIGSAVDPRLARAIAIGDVNPITKEIIVLPELPDARARRSNYALPAPSPQPTRSLGKPINEYFKGHRRVPLGEMDPNCFVVDPQRSAAMTENGLAPRVFPLPRPYLDEGSSSSTPVRPYTNNRVLRRRTEPISNILGPSGASLNSTNRRRTVAPTESAPRPRERQQLEPNTRPPKKARLCEDLPALGEDSLPTERSKFFSPGGQRAPKKTDDIMLRSDDSIADALRDLPDVDGWQPAKATSKHEKLTIFEETSMQEAVAVPAARADTVKDGEATQDEAKEGDDGKDEIEVPASSPTQPSPSEGLSSHVLSATPARSSFSRFAFNIKEAKPRSATGSTKIVHGLPTPSSSMQKPTSSANEFQTPMLTPLQRIGSQAFQRKKAADTPPLTPLSSNSSKRRAGGLSSFPVNPSFVPLPKVDISEVEALNRPCGSEDLIIPESDGENDQDAGASAESPASPEGSKGRVSRLDLSRFVYT